MSGDPPEGERFIQRARLFRWVTASGASLFFLRFTGDVAEEIAALAVMRRLEGGRRRGWGSLPVEARIGETRWRTSIFPGNDASWLLPVKLAVRRAEGVGEDDQVSASIIV